MGEIRRPELPKVADFLEKSFGAPADLAKKFALIAVSLSDTQDFEKPLAGVDAWMETIDTQACTTKRQPSSVRPATTRWSPARTSTRR